MVTRQKASSGAQGLGPGVGVEVAPLCVWDFKAASEASVRSGGGKAPWEAGQAILRRQSQAGGLAGSVPLHKWSRGLRELTLGLQP